MTSTDASTDTDLRSSRLQYLHQHYATTPTAAIADALGIKASSVSAMATRAGIRKAPAYLSQMRREKNTRPLKWTPELLQKVRELYPTTKNAIITERLGITIGSLSALSTRFGLKKLRLPPKPAAPKRATVVIAPMRGPKLTAISHRIAPPMSAAERARRAAERITYPPGQTPWKARIMQGPAWAPDWMQYRGQTA